MAKWIVLVAVVCGACVDDAEPPPMPPVYPTCDDAQACRTALDVCAEYAATGCALSEACGLAKPGCEERQAAACCELQPGGCAEREAWAHDEAATMQCMADIAAMACVDLYFGLPDSCDGLPLR